MGNLVVVAIPAQDERVWKVSSEKVPHLTLLFLGDADSNPNTQRITEFVDHAVTVCEYGPFMLDVDYRGVLGPDEADVLFFKKGWSAKWIEQFRNSLLQNTDIRVAYESTDQFPEWQPHLTLGYPATPANTDDSEHGIRWVSFDRIAVWTGDYAGAEFRLEWPEMDYGGALAYSQETRLGMQFLEHHGVKGMKWGTRKETTAKGGHILGFEAEDPENTLTQTAELGAEFLAHHGIKGMHWGHRKEQVQQRLHAQRVTAEAAKRMQRPAQTVRAYPTIGPSKHKPGNIATKGGEDHPPTKDAIKVAEARQKIKKSGLHALTNDELRDVATRLNLEQQVVTLEGKRGKQKSLGRKFIEGVLNDKGTQKKASEFVFNQVSKKTG